MAALPFPSQHQHPYHCLQTPPKPLRSALRRLAGGEALLMVERRWGLPQTKHIRQRET